MIRLPTSFVSGLYANIQRYYAQMQRPLLALQEYF
jgi:hypothetical protein